MSIPLLGLAAIRLWAILRVQPAWGVAVGPWWQLLAGVFALALAPLISAETMGAELDWGLVEWLVAAGLELLLGTVLGLIAALPGHALLGSTNLSAQLLGLRDASPALVGTCVAFVTATAIALSLHHPLLVALVELGNLFALAEPSRWFAREVGELPEHLAVVVHSVTLLALALASPVLLTAAIVDLAQRVIARGPEPSADLTTIAAPWLRLSAGLLALGATWAAYPQSWIRALG